MRLRAHAAGATEVAGGAAYPYADPELRVCHVEAGDAQLVLERAVDAGQLAVLSSYVLASGALNLRGLWEGGQDVASQPIELVDDYDERTTLIVSTSILRTLERVMPAGRR